MKIRLWLFPLFGIYLLLISATSIKTEGKATPAESQVTAIPSASNTVKAHKLNFLQRLVFKVFVKKHRLADSSNADSLASTSLALGIGAVGFLLIGFLVPYVILGSIPLGVAAMITGGSAVRNGTSQVGKAKTGKALGLGALISFAVLLIAAAIVVSSWEWY